MTDVLDEVRAAGIVPADLPRNPAKLRLLLDLARELDARGPLRVLDVGAGGLYHPFNLWAPLRDRAEELELVGADIAYLDRTAARAAELGFRFEAVEADVLELPEVFEVASFDAVVSTQVLEHLPLWRDALRVMHDALKPGGLLLVTLDSGDYGRSVLERARLAAKCGYAIAARRLPRLQNALRGVLSGDWEWAPTQAAVREATESLGFDVKRLEYYGLRDLKTMQTLADDRARLLWLEYEEALAPAGRDASLYKLLYLRARRPA